VAVSATVVAMGRVRAKEVMAKAWEATARWAKEAASAAREAKWEMEET